MSAESCCSLSVFLQTGSMNEGLIRLINTAWFRSSLCFLSRLQETDYVMSYFDNGEEFGGDSDDNMDEAIYWSTSTEHTHVRSHQHCSTFPGDQVGVGVFVCAVLKESERGNCSQEAWRRPTSCCVFETFLTFLTSVLWKEVNSDFLSQLLNNNLQLHEFNVFVL